MSGTLVANSIQPDVGTNLYLDATQGRGNVIIGNTTTSLVAISPTGNVTLQGIITANGITSSSGNVVISGAISATGNVSGNNITTTNNITANNISSTYDITASSFNGGQLGGMRNRIINGNMMIDQRNAGASVTPADTAYTLDRWTVRCSQASKFTVQQNANSVTPPAGFTNYLGVVSSSAYSVSASDYFSLVQYIEGFNCSDLAWGTASAKTVTLSFQVYSSLTGTFGGALTSGDNNRSYPFSFSVGSANTWTSVSVTIAGDTSGTWLTNNGRGIGLRFNLGAGSTYSGTAGSWASATYYSATGATSVVGTNGATWYVTGVQLEKGATATPFENRLYGTELALCQRYFETSYNGTAVPTNAYAGSVTVAVGSNTYVGGSGASQQILGPVWFKVTKRATPTITTYSYSASTTNAVSNGWTGADLAANTGSVNAASPTKFEFYNASGSNQTTGGYAVLMNFAANAEL